MSIGKARIRVGWSGLREGFYGPFFVRRRQFTRFGPKTSVLIGPVVIWIYWNYWGCA